MVASDTSWVFRNLVEGVKRWGLPVDFLLAAGKRFPPVFTDELSSFSRGVLWDELRLNRDVVKTLGGLSPATPYGGREARAVATLYHEATHGYFGLMKDVSPVKELVEQGISYYRGAPLIGVPGKTVSQPERVVQEAAGMYVDTRIFGWWTAFQLLVGAGLDTNLTEGAFEVQLQMARQTYDSHASERMVGYQHRWWADQEHVDKPILPALKAFVDERLLEGRVPDRFDQVAYFQTLMREARSAHQAKTLFSIPVPTR